MPPDPTPLSNDFVPLSRRFFLGLSAALGSAALAQRSLPAAPALDDPLVREAINQLEPWLTPADKFRDVSRGNPVPHSLSEEQRRDAGLTRETWRLEVLSDPEHPSRLRHPLTKEKQTALDFAGLLQLAETKAIRFAKVMTCLNIGCPLGCGIWEGVPLRDVLWLTQPVDNLRRIIYHGFHNNDPAQMFRSSLPVSRVLEDPFDLPPVILCYKLNGEWLSPERGGPVRMVVPEAYGFKSIKWLSTVIVSNLHHANDTYAEGNNDIDSPLKSFAATLNPPTEVAANQPFPITGYAQAGISGIAKVQVSIHNNASEYPADDKYFTNAPWTDAYLLPPPENWDQLNAEFHTNRPQRFPPAAQPAQWPQRLTKVYWATLHPGLPPGEFTLRCRTVDEQGIAQPMPRPFQKSGHAAIETITIRVRN